jgi:predicted Zn finger-like uncharacterized protein
MQIACPTCAAVYEVPASRLKPGRHVRCARCNAVWKPDPVAEPPSLPETPAPPVAPEPVEPALPQADAMQRLAAMPPPRSPRYAGLMVAWLASVLVLAGAGAGIVIWRDAVVRIWPPSGRILAFLEPLPQQPAPKPGNRAQ